jgi:hypothetical protein
LGVNYEGLGVNYEGLGVNYEGLGVNYEGLGVNYEGLGVNSGEDIRTTIFTPHISMRYFLFSHTFCI